MTPKRTIAGLAFLAAAATFAASSAEARSHHRRHVPPKAPAQAAPTAVEARAPSSFYPNEIEGGVSGNLPFNNQLRKMKDPLNANGAGK